ncbi:unnamed protein product [Urochloa decumbens]|uniref:Exonuclease domain-containing protein n=1 Tax=Urochloa decumbens TaxID=240449 RepID=A0ABC9CZ08_9POAL
MSKLTNMFAVLNLDADDDREEVEKPTSSKAEAAPASKKPDKSNQNKAMIVNYDGENLASSASDYRMPLVWIDLEMTGLDITKDRILEIACIITDGKLTKRIEGPDLVVRQSKECLDGMNEWCQVHHVASGLAEQVLKSEISEHDAEKQKYMPQLAGIFSHVIVDVSSITALCSRWFPKEKKAAPRKEKTHRALDDIRESIKELQYYKENIFKSRRS